MDENQQRDRARRFRENFFDVRNAAHTCWQTSKTEGCDGGRVIDSDPPAPLNCHETADKYLGAGNLYLYSTNYCDGPNDAKDSSGADSDYGDNAGQIKNYDNKANSIVNTTGKHIKFYNYPNYNAGHPGGELLRAPGPGSDGTKLEYGYRGTPTEIPLGFDAAADFHTYEIDWQPNHIAWKVDGVTVYERTLWNPTPIPDRPLEFNLNLWHSLSTEFACRIDANRLPTHVDLRSIVVTTSDR